MNAIVTCMVWPNGKPPFDCTATIKSISQYARRLDVPLYALQRRRWPDAHVIYEKFGLEPMLRRFDRVLYLDADTFVQPSCPNLFDVVPPDSVGAWLDSDVHPADTDVHSDLLRTAGLYLEGHHRPSASIYLNGGVIVVPKSCLPTMEWLCGYVQRMNDIAAPKGLQNDQHLWLALMQHSGVPFFRLDQKFNECTFMCNGWASKHNRFKAHVMHYATALGKQMLAVDRQVLLDILDDQSKEPENK